MAYHLYNDIRNLPNLNKTKRDSIIAEFCSPTIVRDYSFASLLGEISKHLTKDEILQVFDSMISNFSMRRTYYEENVYEFIRHANEHYPDYVRKAILSRLDDAYDKAILLFSKLTPEEEARGLRALSQHKNCPTAIHNIRYAPSKDAMDLLPPVMRLKVLETLANNRHLAYNVFGGFPDPDEFKNMMFSSVMRHRDRAEAVWNKYQEIAYLGQAAEVIIKVSCDNCGEFEVKVKSTRVRTKTGLQSTNLWNSFRYGCALCGSYSHKGIEVIGQDNEQGTS